MALSKDMLHSFSRYLIDSAKLFSFLASLSRVLHLPTIKYAPLQISSKNVVHGGTMQYLPSLNIFVADTLHSFSGHFYSLHIP